ncbi:DUF3993 domain-containing protein [Bacillus salacetis]|uniref:DUF3993 domain-containing protein n=1 Tax=Bacillus salacetis TaxID=2315464 RepID=UPI003B9F2D67
MEKKSNGEKREKMTKMKKLTAVLIAAIFFMTFIGQATALDKESLVERVQTAFEKQVSLSEKPRNLEEINAILDTHFTEGFKEKFMLDNVIETEEGFQTFGSDFASYYIPHFTYSDKTRAVKKGQTVYLYEYFTYEEGPVYFEDGYQGVKLKKINGVLKVEDIFYGLPKELEGEPGDENVQDVQTAKGERNAAPLSSYLKKQYLIFQGFFLEEENAVHLI